MKMLSGRSNFVPQKLSKKMKSFGKTKTHQLTTLYGLTIAIQNEPISIVRKKCRRIAFYKENFEKVWFFPKKWS